MIRQHFCAPTFSILLGAGYSAAVYFNYPMFRYYPLVKRFSTHDLATPSLGPAMSWYGWLATAVVFAGVVTPFISKRIGERLSGKVFWVVILAMFAAAWYRERDWFVSAG